MHQCNPFYGATGIPNKTGTFYGMIPESMTVPKVVVHMNSKGLRDREYEYENLDSFQIMILGDSMIEVLQTPLEQTAQEVLEKLLNNERSDHSNIEVISGAHSGWGTDNEYLFYHEEGYKYRPNLVPLAFYPWNDIRNNSYELQIAMHEYITDPYFVLSPDNNIVLKDFPFPCDASSNKMIEVHGQTQIGQDTSILSSTKKWLSDHSRFYLFGKGRLRQLLSQRVINLLIG